MDKWSKQDVSKGFKRIEGVEVSPELKANIEKAASLHLLAGNMTQYMLAMNSLAKIDSQASLNNAVVALANKVLTLEQGSSKDPNDSFDGIV
tara:strand:- start:1096 stop:1371 length:276 start_codon:yes stop_codon:yes gene_type:complete